MLPPQFFISLSHLFDAHRSAGHGSVFLTQKRLSHNLPTPDPSTSPEPTSKAPPLLQSPPLAVAPVIVHATTGTSRTDKTHSKKKKISTVVPPEELEGFYVRYAEACKAGMQGLKKRDRSGRKKKVKGKGGVAKAP
jgi:signal recognition particle subunit SRP14